MIFKKYFFICTVLTLILLSCKQNNEINNKSKLFVKIEKEENKNFPVIIKGKTDDLNAFKYFNLINESSLFGGNHRNAIQQVIKDSLYLRLDSIKQPGIMTAMAFGDSALYRQRIFVTPGDRISIIIKNKKLQITGKNALHYDFFKEMESINFTDIHFTGDFYNYKKECETIFDKQNEHFNQYINKHKKVSNDFIVRVKAQIKFDYLTKLMFLKQKNRNKQKTVIEVLIAGTYQNKENIFDINHYFDDITLEELNRPELLNNNSFKTFLSSYIRAVLIDPNLENYSSEKFLAEKEFIISNFNGGLRHFLIARLINDYNIFSTTENVYNLKTLIKEYKHNFSESSYIEKIEEIENELKLAKSSLSITALNSKLINLKGDTLLVKDVLQLTRNNIKAIDFWASWCAPCINEILKGDEKRKDISVINNIEWLYFSIDKDKEKWIKKSNELADYGLTKNQYLVLNSENSGLITFLNVNKIPRYVILDKKKLIVNADAPRPSFENQFRKIIDEIND